MALGIEALQESLADRYRIESEIGQGGMAKVYRALDVRHDRPVAIKVMHPEIAASIGSERFVREIEIAARLSHPHILPLFDSGGQGMLLYYVMPFIQGGSLRGRLIQEDRLSLDDALRHTREIAGALGHAHAQGLVHRDIKPENILLADGIAMVSDFGIARATGPTGQGPMTQVGFTLGTPLYMAPEQALGSDDLDGRADLFSLACVLYEMLAGRPPLAGLTTPEMIHHLLSVEPALITDVRPDLPSGIASVLAKGLAKSPADRYPTAARFVEALSLGARGVEITTPTTAHKKEAVPNNLPRSRTPFIGREQELDELAHVLGETRLLTLTGVGGSGKTRMAVRLAERVIDSFPAGVWFVDLAPLADGDRIMQSLAGVMSLREEPGVPIRDTVARHVATARMLVVLDNCEHLLAACTTLVDGLLASSSELRFLATSRESLGVDGEYQIGVRSLPVPGADPSLDAASISTFEAVRLFLDRARAVAPDLVLTEQNAPVIAEICRRLDGIPLAIEFAAARVKLLSLEQIRAKLNDRFRLLTGGSRALPRHQTLQATIQWSYDHLTEQEQQLFRTLSVFPAGWTLPAVIAVQQDGADEFEILDLLTQLVHKSLVVVVREGAQEPRYRMLETVRQYAQERLDESGAAAVVRTRHLDYYVAFVNDVGPKLVGPEQGECLRRLDRDLENLLAAHAWCDVVPDGPAKGLQLVMGLPLYWSDRGLLDLGLKTFREALARPGTGGPVRARVLSAAGSLAFRQGRYDEARGYGEESLAISRQEGDRDRATWAFHLLGAVAHSRGDLAEAARQYEEGLVLAKENADTRALSDLHNALAMIRHAQGDLDAAADLYQTSLELKREMGNLRDVGIVSLNLAQLELQRGGLEVARRSVLEALRYVEETGSKVGGRTLLDTAAGLAAGRQDWLRAARFFGAADAALAWTGAPRDPGDEKVMLPIIERTRNALGAAEFGAAYSAGQVLRYEDSLAEVGAWLNQGPDPDPN